MVSLRKEEGQARTLWSVVAPAQHAWVHRKCAGLSKAAFRIVCESDKPFLCPHCRLDQQELEIQSLRDQLVSLSAKLDALSQQSSLAVVETSVVATMEQILVTQL